MFAIRQANWRLKVTHFRCSNRDCRHILSAGDAESEGSLQCPKCGSESPVPPAGDETVIRQIGGYSLGDRVGEGRAGPVFEATHSETHRRVALRLIPPQLMEDEDFAERFEKESRAAKLLDHPTIADLHEAGEEDGQHFFATEFVDGETLAERLKKEKRLRYKDALRLIEQATMALIYASERKLVHGNIKLSNLMVTSRGSLKLVDFGLAKPIEDVRAQELSDDLAAGIHYLSAEQALAPHRREVRSDIFSLGAVFYALVTGEAPFQGQTSEEVLQNKLTGRPRPVRELNPAVPGSLADVIHVMLAPTPEERYPDPLKLLEKLQGQDAFLVTMANYQAEYGDPGASTPDPGSDGLGSTGTGAPASGEGPRGPRPERRGTEARAAGERPPLTSLKGLFPFIVVALIAFVLAYALLGHEQISDQRGGGGALEEIDTTATLWVDSVPSGAAVFIDGNEAGKTPLERTIDLAAEKEKALEIVVSLPGYQSKGQRVTLRRGQKMTRMIVLKKAEPADQ